MPRQGACLGLYVRSQPEWFMENVGRAIYQTLGWRRDCAELADDRTAPVGEDHGCTCLDHSRGVCGHNVGAKIEFAARDPDNGNQQRGDEPNHYNLEVGGSVCSVH
jgi:hypothetical protein